MPIGIFIALFGYLLGSVPTGLLLTKLFSKIDPRKMGSKNFGATNIFRTAGKGLGILTLGGDVLKGMIPVVVAMRLVTSHPWGVPNDYWVALAGLSPILGHIFPIFLGFKGGKGVATALGIYFFISTTAVIVEALIFIGIVWKWRFISLGSITCAISIPILIALLTDSRAYFILSIIIAALILYRHQSNISRLLQGTENKWRT
jgi:glycerol-3-phosphate acyltransferase PlsY